MARKDLINTKPIRSSFLGCDKDTEAILKTLFIKSKPYSDILKRLLIVNKPDCLDMDNKDYQQLIDSKSLKTMIDEGYIRLNPKIKRPEHEDIKSYILINFDHFTPSKNSEYRDYNINFDIVCFLDEWCLDGFQIRPIQICGYIDGILNSLSDDNKAIMATTGDHIKLSGIGEYRFLGCNESILNEDISMYTLSYRGVHFSEDSKKMIGG